MLVYVITEVEDNFELPLFIADSLRQCGDYIGCSREAVFKALKFNYPVYGRYLENRLCLD